MCVCVCVCGGGGGGGLISMHKMYVDWYGDDSCGVRSMRDALV